MYNSLWPHEPQHPRPPCPSPTPGVHANPCPLSRWCHPTILSSVIPFSSCPQFFPASGSFQMTQCFTSGKPNKKMCLLSSSFDLDISEPRKILHWHLVYLYKVTFDLIKNLLWFTSNRDKLLTTALNNCPTELLSQVL